MDSGRLTRWLQKIYQTQEKEISCTECFDLVSSFVELELSGGDPAVKMPHVVLHLYQCPTCREEYEILHDLCRLENEGGVLSVANLQDLIQ